ncbi:HD-GYP domain-containing protein [Pseudodesulfovibrio sp.]|uniref:HD-GYP domain-containing protein n=1 Tax=unclassified Pseudodesulfovibrio TaxID=2661612 RepID=UPI003B00BA91
MTNPSQPEYPIEIDQLRPGVFVRLEASNWFAHPFLFNAFKIRDEKQITLLRRVGVRRLVCIPERCDVLPLKPQSGNPASVQPTDEESRRSMERLWEIKRERTLRLREKKERIARCEKRFNSSIKTFNAILASIAGGVPSAVEQAVDFVRQLVDTFLDDRESTLHLMNTMDRAEATYSHPMNVAVLSLMIGSEVGLAEDDMIALGIGALFHDIGKAGISKMILHKQGDLSHPEREALERHTAQGVALLRNFATIPAAALSVVGEHHERMDGSGYPDRLSGNAINRLARIVAITDIYDNHTNRLAPEQSLTPYLALSYMFGQQKHLFDMELLTLFIRCLGVYPPGTVVELSNGMVGMVMSVNPRNQLNPSVVLYDESVPRKEALIVDLVDEEELRVEKSIRLAHLSPEVVNYLSPRARISYFVEPK